MKKLLALILCVMMFVSVMSTSAFAHTWPTAQSSTTAIKEANKSIQNMYNTITADEAVFSTAKTIHSLADGLATSIFDGVEKMSKYGGGGNVYHDDLVDNTRAYMKSIIGDTIAKYINDHSGEFLDADYASGVDGAKYMKVFVKAVNDALTSSKAQKGIEAFVTDLYVLKLNKAINDQAEDLQKAIKEWGSSKWDEFGANFGDATDYTNYLAWAYPTLTEAYDAYTNNAYIGPAGSFDMDTVWSIVAP